MKLTVATLFAGLLALSQAAQTPVTITLVRWPFT
jgi:hypothetical protein